MTTIFGSTRIKSTYNSVTECQLLTQLRDLNAGRPSGILRVLGVQDEALPGFYYVTNREEVMALFKDFKPMTTEPGTQIRVLCEAPASYYLSRLSRSYSPKSELAPFIEAELAKQGIVLEK